VYKKYVLNLLSLCFEVLQNHGLRHDNDINKDKDNHDNDHNDDYDDNHRSILTCLMIW